MKRWRGHGQRERDLERELRADLDLEAEEQAASGLSPEAARYAARRAFGNTTAVKEEVREMWRWTWVDQLGQDLRYALRTIRGNPAFSAAAILSLALGIGANTAIFGLMDALLLRFLPVRHPAELVELMLVEQGRPGDSFGYPVVGALAARTDIFAGVCGFATASFNVTSHGSTERVSGAWVTGGFYSALGVDPFAGRMLTPEDDRPGAVPVAVLSYSWWKSRFEGDFGAIGQSIEIEGRPVRIVGIGPKGFDGATVGSAANLTVALGVLPQLFPERERILEANAQWLRVLARPQPGLSRARVKARLALVWPGMASVATTSRMNARRRAVLLASSLDVVPGGTGWSVLRSQFRRPLYVLLAITALVLLIACANFANLLLARGTARAREIALRFAIGAGRGRVVRQLLTESVLLAAAGAALGILLAAAGGRLLLTALSTGSDAIVLDLRPDARVLLFTSGVALATGILFGLLPALRATSHGPAAALKSGAGIAPRSRTRLLPAMVVSQVALSTVLLIGAGLFVRTFQNLLDRDPGFRSEGVLIVDLDGRRAGYNDARLPAIYEEVLGRFQQIPGVRSASISVSTPLNGGVWSQPVSIDGQPFSRESANMNLIGPRFFETLGTPIAMGRDFTPADRRGAPPAAIVNQAFVRKYLPEGSPLGRRIGVTSPAAVSAEIVGVVRNTVSQSLRENAPPFVYLPYFQYEDEVTGSTFEIRAEGSLARTASAVREILRARFSGTPAQVREQPLTQQVRNTLVQERTLAALGTCFGVLALILAAVGLYGLLAYTVARSTSEIGIRMALGARRREVLALILTGALRLLALGVAVGIPVAWAGARWIASMLFGLTGADPLTALGAAILLAATALLAALIPAVRAAQIDALVALRYE